jgi:hypothetical protein
MLLKNIVGIIAATWMFAFTVVLAQTQIQEDSVPLKCAIYGAEPMPSDPTKKICETYAASDTTEDELELRRELKDTQEH